MQNLSHPDHNLRLSRDLHNLSACPSMTDSSATISDYTIQSFVLLQRRKFIPTQNHLLHPKSYLSMKQHRILIFCLWLFSPVLIMAQLSPYYEFQYLYDEAVDLFEKEKYGAAQKKIDTFLEFEDQLRTQDKNDLHAYARYIQAMSSFHLERNDAIPLMESFLKEFGSNTKAPLVRYFLGKYYFKRSDYRSAIVPLETAKSEGRLRGERLDEVIFMIAYSYFKEGNNIQAVRYFDIAGKGENKYQEDALYYRSVILYQDEEYQNAYLAFQDLKSSKKYGQEVKVYEASSLLKLKKYDELNTLAEGLIGDRAGRGKSSEIFYIAANSNFEREDYPKTTEYYGQFVKSSGRKKMTPTDYFRFGYSHYKQATYKDAIPNFEKALKGVDSLSQMASYYLGFCFLEEKNQDAAKLAFKKSALGKGSIHPTVKEDALYQYAKLAFATTDYDESLKALALLRKKYPNAPYMDEVKAMTGEIYLFTRDYKNSIQFFESTTPNTPRSVKAYQTVCYFYGLELFEVPKYDNAIKYLKKAATFQSPHKDPVIAQNAQYWIGEATFRKGDFSAARQAYLAFIRSRNASSNENFAKAYYGIGWTYFKQKSYSEALKGFDDFLTKGGLKTEKNLIVDAYLRAGDCLFLTKNFSKANTYYQKVLNRKYTYRDYAAFQMAESFYRQSRYQESVTTFAKMINGFKSSEYRPNALDRISDIYANWIKNPAQASKYAKMLVDEYPRSTLAASAYNRLAQASYNQGNTNQAIKYFKKVLSDYGKDKKNAQIALDNLSNLLPEKQFDKILADYRKGNPDTDDNFGTLVFNTGKDRFFASNYSSAIEQFSTYIKDYKNGPNYFEALIFRARSFTETNQKTKALADYRQVYSAPVNNNFTGVALQEAGEINYEQKEYIKSLQLFQQLESNSNSLPNKVQAWFGVAKNHKAMGDYGPAEDALAQIANNNEVQVYSRTKASVEIGHCQYLDGNLDAAYLTFSNIEQEYKNAFGAESQHMITQILFDQGKEFKAQGDPDAADARFEEVKAATIYQKNNYPTFNYWKAKTFFIAANAYYELGNSFQAKGTLESLVAEPRFPDVQAAAKKRLEEIEAEEAAADDATGN